MPGKLWPCAAKEGNSSGSTKPGLLQLLKIQSELPILWLCILRRSSNGTPSLKNHRHCHHTSAYHHKGSIYSTTGTHRTYQRSLVV
mmetsp:Transcript_1093/g.1708  ORF Transcript_1093/g.1708 Transcript_1093/m.1708 type:complete len:86 (-) Transcript_1093:2422-2679(-)